MNETLLMLLSLLSGMLLGVFFFGGLWWTVRKGLSAQQPALWFFTSLIVRSTVVVAGFYLVAGSDWKRQLLCLLGFIVTRFIVTRRVRSLEASHAP